MPGTKRKRGAAASKPSSIKPPAKAAKKATETTQPTQKATDSTKPSPPTIWLIKSEPETRMEKGVDVKFSLDDLKAEPDSTAHWDGVRNYQARNHMMAMKKGQTAFFYHSNCKPPGIVGLVEVAREHYVDHTQFDPKDPHFDAKSKKEEPRWRMVDVKYVRHLKRYIPLPELKTIHLKHKGAGKGALRGLSLFTSARLSVQPITQEEFDFILAQEDVEESEDV